ncbi:BCCT family transporter [Rhodococcus sp. BP-149]|uniref:BCCT family transporter n=1 Tax=unclassified Rhodococcus (in: high G+C Gram-positive bacteria) TaxID=192944 RepID=UPI001C9B438D|nr:MULTISPECIES: BCCT family transporter [unclassified Rhodococcus (in: high G+C Gram-positive bacteria)]MBY6685680.1 BCCT family transporter [Rhodococcus sp. BP-288]MBY6694772.1 BCCT family transporter [Rhodococcus sp. BP-188]MBY6696618.1 BCCT family transporter [Rhodococcus sp. BP-285]MBY6703274.1 BCCT family transporter [Rhodococcus sp. BP-283]MBY6710772.1 BCCT family transporter [Rhodococcus sp. BP-160]
MVTREHEHHGDHFVHAAPDDDRTDIEPDDAKLPVDKVVFIGGLLLTLAFVGWGVISPASLASTASAILAAIIDGTGWAYVLATTAFVFFMLFLALSRLGRIRLGKDDERPEFSTVSWISMMFATGMGIGLIFWGVAEPLSHLLTPPMDMAAPESTEAARLGMQYTIFHWGLQPWALYGVVGLALAYATFRKGLPNLLSTIVFPSLDPSHPARRAIDIFGLFITTFGAATSLGLGAIQINSGLARVFGAPISTTVSIIAIVVLTALFVLSAVTGTQRGIKWMANINAVLAVALMVFVFVLGPTVFLMNMFVESFGDYVSQFIPMSFRTGTFGGNEWLSSWTIFYWAWWMSWAPFVGTFMARISRGRTIREFVVCVLIVPTIMSLVWFVIMGGTGIRFQLDGTADMAGSLASGVENTLFTLVEALPIPAVTSVVVVVLIMLFYVAGADSASLVLGMLSQGGSLHPRTWLVVLWGTMIGAVAIALLLAGGLDAIQTTVIVFGIPFLLVMVGVCISLVRQLRAEPVAGEGEKADRTEPLPSNTTGTDGGAQSAAEPTPLLDPSPDNGVPEDERGPVRL